MNAKTSKAFSTAGLLEAPNDSLQQSSSRHLFLQQIILCGSLKSLITIDMFIYGT